MYSNRATCLDLRSNTCITFTSRHSHYRTACSRLIARREISASSPRPSVAPPVSLELWGSFVLGEISQALSTMVSGTTPWELTSCSPIPSLRILDVRWSSDPNLGEIAHSVLGLGQPSRTRLPRPKIGFRVALLQNVFGTSEIPSGKCKFALVLLLHGCLTVPCYTLPRIDWTSHASIFISGPKTVLRELIAQFSRLDKKLLGISFVSDDVVIPTGTFE